MILCHRVVKMWQLIVLFTTVTYVTQICSVEVGNLRTMWGEIPSRRTGSVAVSRLANSNPASRGQFPYQAVVIPDDVNLCGGSLISGDWILTSGMCTSGMSTFQVSLGVVDFLATEEGSVTFTSREGIAHEDFNEYTFNNDIGLVKIPIVINFSKFVSPVNLPTSSDITSTYEDNEVQISGWGSICNGSKYVNQLRFIETCVISNEDCLYQFPSYAIHESKLCTQDTENTGLLGYDSGDPVVIQETLTQIGIASFSTDDVCDSGAPSAHTRLTSYLSWIDDKTNLLNQTRRGEQRIAHPLT